MTKRAASAPPSLVTRLWGIFRNAFDQFLMILDLQTLDDSIPTRLKRLRQIYYGDPKVTVAYKRVKDVLRGHVDKAHYDYYERLLTVERLMVGVVADVPAQVEGDELLWHCQLLSEKIAQLIEQLEHLDSTLKLYPPESENYLKMAETRAWLLAKIEESLTIHAGLPAEVMKLKQAATERSTEHFKERLARLSSRLEEITEVFEAPPSEQARRLSISDSDLENLLKD